MRESGEYVISATYVNDFGSHVAKSIWAYKQRFGDKGEEKNADSNYKKQYGVLLGELYAYATAEADKDEKIKREILEIFKKLEAKDKETVKIWKKTRKWSLDEFKKIYKILGIDFDQTFYESDYFEEGKKLTGELLKKGILKESQGAIIADLEKFGLGVLVFITQEGTSLYCVKDIPLAIDKFKKYNIKKSIYFVDVRQNLYFKQLFKVLNLMGQKGEMIHLDYEFVTLPSGAMSSRTGNIVSFNDLYDELVKISFEETKKRHNDWRVKKVKETAENIALSALKFNMLKSDMKKVIVFDIKKSLEFSGNTGPYLLYSNVRAKSILEKTKKIKIKKEDLTKLQEKEEKQLLKDLSNFDFAILQSAKEYKPSILAQYLLDLANDFNSFYHECPVLSEKNEEIKNARIILVKAVNCVMEKGLDLLGIQNIEQM